MSARLPASDGLKPSGAAPDCRRPSVCRIVKNDCCAKCSLENTVTLDLLIREHPDDITPVFPHDVVHRVNTKREVLVPELISAAGGQNHRR